MKNLTILAISLLWFVAGIAQSPMMAQAIEKSAKTTEAGIIHLNKEQFKKLVYDYEKNDEWKYEGSIPAIVDFYADWCRPCKMVGPVLAELQSEYGGKIQVYKVNTQYEQELAAAFGISGIPAFLFIPVEGKPSMTTGAIPKESFEKYIDEILKVKK